jgi:hydroxymethylglutaryl-CoA reductase
MSNGKKSTVSGFYKLPVEKRVEFVKDFSGLNEEESLQQH